MGRHASSVQSIAGEQVVQLRILIPFSRCACSAPLSAQRILLGDEFKGNFCIFDAEFLKQLSSFRR